MKSIFLSFVSILALSVGAETYGRIAPLDSFGEIKSKYPGAEFVRVNPEWATERDAVYIMSGADISGGLLLRFGDNRPEYEGKLQSDLSDDERGFITALAEMPDDDALIISWMRWQPSTDAKIPVKRLIAKYGKEFTRYYDENLEPMIGWPKRGVKALLFEDERTVKYVDFLISEAERKMALDKRYKNIQ